MLAATQACANSPWARWIRNRIALRMNHAVKNLVIAISLIAAGFLIAWLRFRPHLETSGSFTDGQTEFSALADEPLRYALWEEAQPLAGLATDASAQSDPCLSPDGRWMVLAVGERGFNVDLWMAPMQGSVPGPLRILHEINSDGDDLAPAFYNDALYFASNRQGGAGGFDLWKAEFVDGEFALAERLPDTLNSKADETDPALDTVHGQLVFASNRKTEAPRNYDLYSSTVRGPNAFEVSPLTELNSPNHERDPAFTADGRTLFFASNRGESGRYRLYRSVLDRLEWLAPSPIEGLAVAGDLRGPHPSPDGFRLLFTGEQPPASPSGSTERKTSVFEAPTRELFLRPGQPIGWFEILLLLALLLLALLAWLAKRWTTVEVIYRCFLVSLLVHGLLMWWFQDVHPENPPVELAERAATYQVRLALDASASRARQAERGGRLEVERTHAEAPATQPERAQAQPSESEPTPEAAAAAEPLRLASAPATAPARSASAISAQAVSLSRAQVALNDAQSPEPLFAGEAAQVPLPTARSASLSERRVAQPLLPAGSPLANAEPTPRRPAPGPAARGIELAPQTPAEVARSSVKPSAATSVDSATRWTETPIDAPMESFEAPVAAAETGSTGIALPTARESFQRQSTGAGREAPTPERPSSASGAQATELPAARPAEQESAGPAELASANTDELAALQPREATLGSEDLVPTPAEQGTVKIQGPEDLASDSQAIAEANRSSTDADSAEPAEPSAQAFERRRSRPDLASALTPKRIKPEPDRPRAQPEPAKAPKVRPLEPAIVSLPQVPKRQDLPLAKTPYRNRFGLAKERALAELGGSAETEAAVASGLKYLASVQQRNGYWGVISKNFDKYRQLRIGKTGLSVLAFLGAGHTHRSDTEYSPVVAHGLRYLVGKQDPISGHFGDCSAYGHAIATYALAECFALTEDPELRIPIEKGVRQILSHQSTRRQDPRFFGGWNYYYPDDEVYDSWPRVSVTSWQVMALESARLGGIGVPQAALDNARTFLRNSWDDNLGAFRYNHSPSRLSERYPTLPASTPAAMFALSLLGDDLRGNEFGRARAYLTERIPTSYTFEGERDFVFRGQGNLYFWYYSSLALLRVGGDDWKRWNAGLKATLLPSQDSDGSWSPISIYAEYAADTDSDRSYTTALCVLSLEVYYRYFTPLLQER